VLLCVALILFHNPHLLTRPDLIDPTVSKGMGYFTQIAKEMRII